MDYEVGSIADLISGFHTPNRPRVQCRPLPPTKKAPPEEGTPRSTPPKSLQSRKLPVLSNELKTLDSDSVPRRNLGEKRIDNFRFLSELSDYESDDNGAPKGEFCREYYVDKNGIVKENGNNKKSKKNKKEMDEPQYYEESLVRDVKKCDTVCLAEKESSHGEESNLDRKSKSKKTKRDPETQPTPRTDEADVGLDRKRPKSKTGVGKENLVRDVEKCDTVTEASHVEKLKSNKRDKSKKAKRDAEAQPTPRADENETDLGLDRSKRSKRKTEAGDETKVSKKVKKAKLSSVVNDDRLAMIPDAQEEQNNENDAGFESDAADESAQSDEGGLTDFQKAAQRRIENKAKRQSKFEENEIGRTLFVGNIPVSLLKKKYKKVLKHKFSPYGDIESIRIRNVPVVDMKTNPKVAFIEKKFHPERSTVTAYIKFVNPISVKNALVENNTMIEENHIRVDSCAGDNKPQTENRKTLFLGNLPFNIEEEKVRELFEKCGPITSVRIIRDNKTQIGKGFGFVNFEKADGVEFALLLPEEDLQINNKTIRIKRYNSSNPKADTVRNDTKTKNFNQKTQQSKPGAIYHASKKRDEQGNKIRKRNLVPKQENDQISPKFKTPDLNNSNTNSDNYNSSFVENGVNKNSKSGDFKGLVAKKKKKNRLNKGVLKKKKISKILTKKTVPRVSSSA